MSAPRTCPAAGPIRPPARHARVRRALFVPIALFVAFAGVLVAPARAGAATGAGRAGDEWQLAALVNKARVDEGRPPLPVMAAMRDQARAWSATMAVAGRISHHPDLAAEASSVAPDYTGVGENVGSGAVAALHDAFLASRDHRANILGTWDYLAIGVVTDAGGRPWVTQRFLRAGQGRATIAQVATTRLAGSDGVSVSRALYPVAGTADVVVVARDDAFADALAGGPLAARRNGPILLTGGDTLPASILQEVRRALRVGGTVVILGGPEAVTPSVEDGFRAAGLRTSRISGPDRFATAVAVADALTPAPAAVFLASGLSFPDAIVGGSPAGRMGAPILLTTQGELPAATAAYLGRTRPPTVHVLGGDAVVGEAVSAAAGASERAAGADRYETSVRIAQRFFPSATEVTFTTGQRWQDALVASPLAARRGTPIVLTEANPPLPVFAHVRDRAPALVGAFAVGVVPPATFVVLFGSETGHAGSEPTS